jgi:glycerophosphoryl diester phosphodiesterase
VPTGWAYLDHPEPIPFAHRGGASECPENTLAAFQAAVDLGYRYLETDVHVTADGVLLAFHDETLDRVTDRQGRIRDLPWSVVREARVDGKEPIPLLEDILGEWPHARVNIDVKHETSVVPLVEVLRRTNSFDRVCVAAFSDGRLLRVRRLTGLRVCTALGPREIGQLRIASFGWPAGTIGGACVQVPPRLGGRTLVDRRFVDTAHRRGLDVHVWTIDHATEMERLLDLGVDGIMTDRPAILKQVLEQRGQWA